MKKLFYLGIIGLALFEILKVYFIMPMPGSQEMNSIDLAYFLYSWRWLFRGVFIIAILAGVSSRRWLVIIVTSLTLIIIWAFNFEMVADHMFYQPDKLLMTDVEGNRIPDHKLVLGITMDGASRAYPLQLIAYHHQVLDTINGKPIMVTYCSVCRTGRIYEPKVDGNEESFRLVGMDHFNAMFEDQSTKSWWRQVSGEAIAGPLTGTVLPELMSEQMTLKQWITLHPETLIMHPDSAYAVEYASLEDYDFGVERGALTRTDTLSWKAKSWVVGVTLGDSSFVVDWNDLKDKRIINFTLNNQPVVLAMATDDQSFFAYERPSSEATFIMLNDTLIADSLQYNLLGDPVAGNQPPLKQVKAYQEFWHSWNTFHPDSRK